MKVYHVKEKAFAEYGRVLEGYDFSEMFTCLGMLKIPEEGITYTASVKSLEKCKVKIEFQERGFGGLPIQIGYVSGKNRTLNCLEYHKTSELNIAMNDIILVLGKETQMEGNTFDTSKCKAFFVPAGTGVELYGITLHYAPFNVDEEGYRVVCVLPLGTNQEKTYMDNKDLQDELCYGVNKWLMAHPEADEASKGACGSIIGKNITWNMMEKRVDDYGKRKKN